MTAEVAPGVIEIDTLLGGWAHTTAGYLLDGSAPVLVETGSQSSVPVLLDALGANVERVVVSEVRDATYFAEIHLAVGGRALELSSRPSDAIALAARTHSPLFVEDELMESAGVVLDDDEDDDDEAPEEIVGEFREFLERVRPEDFTT